MFSNLLHSLKCPHCGIFFEKKPKRSSVCKNCNNRFFVRRGKIITREKALVDDFYLSFSNFLKKKEVENLVINRPNLAKNDYLWSLIQLSILKVKAGNNDQHSLFYLYCRLANILKEEGRDSKQIREVAEEHLKKYVDETFDCLTQKEKDDMIKDELKFIK